ncbi:hypothetical protein [Pseudaminobacter sp. NGMCC 1.201702]|uniref:hypothetical protein n=1 Tax=Pseudaminobacter sp. NGMCC 1.201702 TaxID=3391825 RepID=UPI0039EE957B
MTLASTSTMARVGKRFWLIYLLLSAVFHLSWEIAHSPLYALWRSGSPLEIVSDIAQCTLGDIAIAAAAIVAGSWFTRKPFWPLTAHSALAVVTVLTGFLLTVAIEWVSVHLLGRWSYDAKMLLLPYVNVGISPLLQWLIVPAAVLWLTLRLEGTGSRTTKRTDA